eukprot:scaffold574703_cov42-Prasinocladus_malaysianus.AAC.1
MPATVVDVTVNSPNHTALVAALTEAGLARPLTGEGPFTVFAPTDTAIASALQALNISVEEFLASPDLATVLQYHVVAAEAMSSDLSDGMELTTLVGEALVVSVNNGTVMINGATVTMADLEAGNGVVHVIDAVLLPVDRDEQDNQEELPATVVDIIANSPNHTTLEVAVSQANL